MADGDDARAAVARRGARSPARRARVRASVTAAFEALVGDRLPLAVLRGESRRGADAVDLPAHVELPPSAETQNFRLDEPALRTSEYSLMAPPRLACIDCRACAASTATAQLAIFDRTLSARLVRMIGTRAPSTSPALSALARKLSCLARMLPASRSGTSRMSGSPATSDPMPLIRAASALIALSNASGPSRSAPVICPRSAILHSAAASSVAGIFDVTVSTAARIATFGRARPSEMAQVDRVLADVDLVLERRRDVDRRIGDDQHLVIGRHVHDEHVAEAPAGAQAGLARHDRTEQLVGVEAALHQQLGLALPHQFDRPGRRRVAVRRVDDRDRPQRDAVGLRDLLDLRLRADEDRRDQPELGRIDDRCQRRRLARVCDCRRHRLEGAAPLEELFVLPGSMDCRCHIASRATTRVTGWAAGPVSLKRSVNTTARATPYNSGSNAV